MSRETKCILVRSRDRCHKVIGSVFEGKSVALFLYINTELVHCRYTFFIFSFFNIKKFSFSLCVFLVFSRIIF